MHTYKDIVTFIKLACGFGPKNCVGWQVHISMASQGEQMLQSTSKVPSVQRGFLLEKMDFVLLKHLLFR